MAIATQTPGSGGLPINAPLGSGFESGVGAAGGVSVVKITGLSSDITVAAKNLLTAYNGDIEIINAIVETDATGLAGGTNFQLGTDDPVGLAVFLAETVANLGANKTVDLFSASVTKQRTIIHQGKHLQVSSTVAACTGAGGWQLYVEYRPLVSAGQLA